MELFMRQTLQTLKASRKEALAETIKYDDAINALEQVLTKCSDNEAEDK